MSLYIGVDIGGTTTRVSLGKVQNRAIEIINQSEVLSTKNYKVEEVIDWIKYEIIALKDGMDVSAIGISCGGPLNSKDGLILSPPNLPGWDKIDIVNQLKSKFNEPIYLCNDANAGALAEWRYGAGKGSENMIFLTFGTGLGAGLILNNRLYSGTSDMAGELGHIRLSDYGPVGYGKAGSFEGFCSGGGIAQLAKTRVHELSQKGISYINTDPSAKDIALLAKEEDALALEVIKDSAQKLGLGLSILIDLLNPEKIVIGSIYTRNENLFRNQMMEILEKECLESSLSVCEILPAKLNESIGDISALTVASYYSDLEKGLL